MSMLRNMATSLINSPKDHIVTTVPKAKELRPFVERVITLARKAQVLEGDDAVLRGVHLRRQAAAFSMPATALTKLSRAVFAAKRANRKSRSRELRA